MDRIDHFTIKEFQEAIDSISKESKVVNSLGEVCWLIPIDDKSRIRVRSSISVLTGKSEESGENSIRLRLEDNLGDYLAKTQERWITRLPGWRDRLNVSVGMLKAQRKLAGDCKKCGRPNKIIVSHTEKNPGRLFAKCAVCGDNFAWLDKS